MSKKRYKNIKYRVIVGVSIGTLLLTNTFVSAAAPKKNEGIRAASIVYDETNVLVARGDVQYTDDEYEMKAKTVRYDTDKAVMLAEGGVIVTIYKVDTSGKTGILYADKLEYNKKENVVVAYGNVKLDIDGNEIQGNKLEYYRQLHSLVVTKNASFKNKDGDTVTGSSLHYDVESKQGQVEKFIYTFSEDGIIYNTWGESLNFSDDKTVLQKAELTTCNLKQPHFKFAAEKAEYYPKKKLILFGATSWEKDKKAAYVGKVVIPLHDKESAIPEAGYSADEGWYVKTKEFFDLTGKDYGIIYRDYMTRRGGGYGVRKYFFTDNGHKEIYWYAARNPLTSNQTLKGEWRIQNSAQDQMLSVEDDSQKGQGHELTAKWSYLGKGDKTTTTADVSALSQSSGDQQSNMDSHFSQSIRNSKELRTFLSYDFYRYNSKFSTYQDRNGSIRFEYTQPQYIAQISSEEHKYGFDYIPKFDIQSTFSSPLQFQFSTARVSRNYSDFSVQQSELISRYNSEPVKISKTTFLQTNANIKRTAFSDNNNLTDWNGTVNVLTNFNARLYTNTSFKHSQSRGFNPLLEGSTDNDASKMGMDINYRFDDNYRMRLSGDYDLRSRMLNSITVNVDGRTYPFWNWSINGEYSGQNQDWKSVGAYLTLNPDSRIMGYIKVNYSLEERALSEASLRLEGDLFDVWSYSIKTDYARYNSLTTVSELKFTRSLHCRDLAFTAYPHENMFFMEMILKN
jgi:lipopolysaccharide assembly outer membrane protein LptD (OstA)